MDEHGGTRTLRVVIVDDEYLVREGARSVLSSVPGIEVVATAGDPQELMDVLGEARPDVVLLDIKMPPTHRAEGIEAAREIRAKYPHIGVVILSQYADPEYALELLRDGSRGLAYLLKERLGRPAQLAEALHEVAEGGSTLDPKVVDALMQAQRRRSRSRIHGLTDREYEVLALMASGRTNAGIAARLFLSQRAVEKHSHAIFRKLGLGEDLDINQRVSAVLFFLEKEAD
jgi:DNA-binding NarL/FixJ family response regulator